MPWRTSSSHCLLAVAAFAGWCSYGPAAEGDAFFEKRIRPLLVEHCYSCHSADAKKVKGDLRLDTRAGLRKGGRSGAVVVPGDPEASPLIAAVRYRDKDTQMPPKGQLPPALIADLEAWVKMGAPDPRADQPLTAVASRDLWSLRPVQAVAVPAVKDAAWPRTPVDRFLLAALEQKGLRPVPAADRRVLIRRVTYDLTGLPPTPEEVAAFLADESPDAYEQLIERLLASPHYGEHWGRHWLDVVRYADTAGDNSDYPVPQLYRYRNWVLRAVNADEPYDQFVREQLAGDLLPSADEKDKYDKLIATGYLANAHRFGSYEDARYPWYLTIEDTIENLGRTFLGLTINCCRCHDHKFDPLTNEDYYALYGFFQSTRYPWAGTELDKAQHDLIPLAPAARAEEVLQARQRELAALGARIKELQKEVAAVRKPVEGPPLEERELKMRADALTAQLRSTQKQRERLAQTPLPVETAYAVAEGDNRGTQKVGNARIQMKGDPERLGPEVPRRFPTVLGGQRLPPGTPGSGRLQLARWLTEPSNPLTARVMVNRVWHYHFGKGIVQTPSDFGKQGARPTHPELLDYLARRFVDSGWSLKAMHRLILRSRAYQLASEDDAANAALDVNNDHLWRFGRHRLEAEAIRDTLLAVSGALDTSVGGPHPFPEPTTWDFTQHKPFKAVYDTNRRSVYLMTQRIQRHPFLGLFDGPDTNTGTGRRGTSTTPLQALYLMNDPFVHAQARQFAARLLAEGADDAGRVERAYQLLFGRPASAAERATAQRYLDQVGDKAGGTLPAWESFARALFLSNELVYLH